MTETKKKTAFHGSDLERIASFYGVPLSSLTGFGSNVNPLGISPKLRAAIKTHADCITHYPDRDYTALKAAISAYTHASPGQILIGNGATELIGLIIHALKPQNALLIGPSYSEYGRVIKRDGGTLTTWYLKEEEDFVPDMSDLKKALPGKDLLIICNPNNPTGTVIKRADLTDLLQAAEENGVFTMIDETYIEFTEAPSKVSAIPLVNTFKNLFVLRGVSKFFAAPGLRLGYAVTGNAPLMETLKSVKDPWTVHTLAAECAPAMFADQAYIEETSLFTRTERSRILKKLGAISNLKVYPTETNFLLMKILRDDLTSTELFEMGVRKGLVIRDCSSFPSLGNRHFRISLMQKEDNDRLIAFLKEALN